MRYLLATSILLFSSLAYADGTLTVKVGNGIGDYDAAWDYLGAWGGVDQGALVSKISYQMVYPDLYQLPGSDKTVTDAKFNIYMKSRPYCDIASTMYFYEGEGRPSGTGTPDVLWSWGPLYGELWTPETTATGWHELNMDVPLVQGWIDTPANNEGFSFDNGTSLSTCGFDFRAIDYSIDITAHILKLLTPIPVTLCRKNHTSLSLRGR